MEAGKHDAMSHGFRLQPLMRQGTASSVPEAWDYFETMEDARRGAKRMYRDDRVLRVMVVEDTPRAFVGWIDR